MPRYRYIALVPFLFSLVALTFALIALYAGTSPGLFEEVAIIRINSSMLGANIFGKIPHIPGMAVPRGLVVQERLLDFPGGLEPAIPSNVLSASTSSPANAAPPTEIPLPPSLPLRPSSPPPQTLFQTSIPSSTTQSSSPPTASASLPDNYFDHKTDGLFPGAHADFGIPKIPGAGEITNALEHLTSAINSEIKSGIPAIASIIHHEFNVTQIISEISNNLTADVKGTLVDIIYDLNNFTGSLDFSKGISGALGISDWYSFHLMSYCHGKYTPSPIDPDVQLNVTHCSSLTIGSNLNFTALLNHNLGVGPFHLNLAKLGFQHVLQDGLDIVNFLILIIAYCYILGICFCAGNAVGALLVFLLNSSRLIAILNYGTAGGAAFFLVCGAGVTTFISTVSYGIIETMGRPIGLHAVNGTTFMLLSWTAVALSVANLLFWLVEFCCARRPASTADIKRMAKRELAKQKAASGSNGDADDEDEDEDEDSNSNSAYPGYKQADYSQPQQMQRTAQRAPPMTEMIREPPQMYRAAQRAPTMNGSIKSRAQDSFSSQKRGQSSYSQ